MNSKLTKKEREYIGIIKSLSCGVCGAQPPSEAHHIEQGLQYTCIPLCSDCHRGGFNGLHGQKRLWNILKKRELSVLSETIGRLFNQGIIK